MSEAAVGDAGAKAQREAYEAGPRRALTVGAALLTIGLAIVGTGEAHEGGPIAAGGLLTIIYGIHRFGRLGPDDTTPEDGPHQSAIDSMFIGIALTAAGLAFSIGAATGTVRYLLLGAGAIVTGIGHRRSRERAPRPKAAPVTAAAQHEADDGDEPPAPRRARRRRREP